MQKTLYGGQEIVVSLLRVGWFVCLVGNPKERFSRDTVIQMSMYRAQSFCFYRSDCSVLHEVKPVSLQPSYMTWSETSGDKNLRCDRAYEPGPTRSGTNQPGQQ